jgi:hypothetical protein
VTFTASINIFRNGTADAAGAETFGGQAYSDAIALPMRFRLQSNLDILTRAGLAFSGQSKVRDLTALVDANWESRAQVDIDFSLTASESAVLDTYAAFQVELRMQLPGASAPLIQPIEVPS